MKEALEKIVNGLEEIRDNLKIVSTPDYIKGWNEAMGACISIIESQKSLAIPKEEYWKGFDNACDLLEGMGYTNMSTHEYNIADCLKAKVNRLKKEEVRKNPKSVKEFSVDDIRKTTFELNSTFRDFITIKLLVENCRITDVRVLRFMISERLAAEKKQIEKATSECYDPHPLQYGVIDFFENILTEIDKYQEEENIKGGYYRVDEPNHQNELLEALQEFYYVEKGLLSKVTTTPKERLEKAEAVML